ncbi:hypothetical protein C5F44_14965 [Fuscovulum blasticum DSM 2131]|uniref:Hint domain-containing protein n=2 Tax=Fuscovulum blasticum TaxID=1075 RepID=A0A2T4J5P2_FUSBL|nr:hypothetical protein C5F44_14965 [Fuscovulum blasticum DSM 2131]
MSYRQAGDPASLVTLWREVVRASSPVLRLKCTGSSWFPFLQCGIPAGRRTNDSLSGLPDCSEDDIMPDVFGTNGNDSWTNNNTNDRYFGNDGNDTMVGGNGTEVLFPGSNSAANGDWIYGGNGNDLYYGNGGNDVFVEYETDTGKDTMYGGNGNDTMHGGADSDRMSGDDGDDYMNGGTGSDSMLGGAGNDYMFGHYGADTLSGGTGNDTIDGDNGADSINGGDGNDSIDGAAGTDVSYGGAGNDTIYTDANTGGPGDNFDTIYGGDDDDVIYGFNNGQALYGDAGNDIISGDNKFSGGSESNTDTSESDSLYGGTGDDTVYSGYTGTTSAYGDYLDGGEGRDNLVGGTASDTLYGGSGADSLSAGQGNDHLDGGAGDDTLTGGTGDDLFIWTGATNDVITDFGTDSGVLSNGIHTDNDFVDLSGIYDTSALGEVNTRITAAGGKAFHTELGMLRADAADGKIDGIINGTDYRTELGITGSLEMTGVASGFLNFDNTAVVCFGADTLILTLEGPVRAGDLSAGDMVLTLDNGYQPVRWIGKRRFNALDLARAPHLRPVRIRAGAMGANMPEADLIVSPQHRVLVRGAVPERMFGVQEVLVAAKQLLGMDGFAVAQDLDQIEYVHFLFDQHQIVWSNGAPTESLFTGPEALKAVNPAQLEEILAIFPELANTETVLPELFPPVRLLVPGRRARSMADRLARNDQRPLQGHGHRPLPSCGRQEMEMAALS